ncbi:protein DENND6A-like [Antedon mediterranea]|uniref:protein DENND6A-like n=1 Tax=Antedon mediterranea TaxID=105859 RepID=UPI003AF621CA
MATMDRDRVISTNSSEITFKSSAVLPWDNFSNWLYCVCVVTFDLELGQALEFVYPSHVKLTEKERMNICYLSFPDSNSGCMGDTRFLFRIRRCMSRPLSTHSRAKYDTKGPFHLQSDSAHLYGYVYFRQVKDNTSRRGYFQKSVVVLSKLPYVMLFSHLVNTISPEYFEHGEPSLEAACHDIDQWPTPIPGETLHLPIIGNVLHIRMPSVQDKLTASSLKKPTEFSGSPLTILPSINEVDLFRYLQPVLPHIQLLWELILLGEPLVVMAPSPTECSNTVQALVSMIHPLRFMQDYRPYFTIHDSEFKEYTTRTQAPPCVVLGVTNPFFAKTLQHWPHVIRIGDTAGSDKSNPKVLKPKKTSSMKTLESKPGVYTQYKPYLQKDKTITKKLAKGIQTKRPSEVQDAILRRHLLELTQSFMIPLERYLASLMPLQRNVSPWKGPPRLKEFEIEAFLKTLEHSGPQLTSGLKGDWEGLYKKFFISGNFEGWLHHRQKEVNQKLSLIHLEAVCSANLVDWIKDKREVEIVDLILKLRERVDNVLHHDIHVKPELLNQLKRQIDNIIHSLPEDLQTVLKNH